MTELDVPPLLNAIWGMEPERVRLLLAEGSPLKWPQWAILSALTDAIWFLGDREIVQQMLDLGADPNDGGRLASPPLSAAAACGHLHIVRLLLERGADPNIRDCCGESPLDYAAKAPAPGLMIALLVEHGALPRHNQ